LKTAGSRIGDSHAQRAPHARVLKKQKLRKLYLDASAFKHKIKFNPKFKPR
jgi:hypothetical protein